MKKSLRLTTCATVIFLAIPSLVLARAIVSIHPPEMKSPAAGKQFAVNVNIIGGANIAGYQITVKFDPRTLSFVDIENANYLPVGAFVVPPVLTGDSVTLAATSLAGASNGDGTLAIVTFAVARVRASTIRLAEVALSDPNANQLDVIATNGRITGPAGANGFPAAIIEATPARVVVGKAVSLNGAGSIDDGGISRYVWNFGDGTNAQRGEIAKHVYDKPGNYTVTLTVTDNGRPPLTDQAILIITVADEKLPVYPQGKQMTSWGRLKITK